MKFGANCGQGQQDLPGPSLVAARRAGGVGAGSSPREEAGGRRITATKNAPSPVAPSSDFPTDRRRSDCLPESHQPLAFRTRCIAHTRVTADARQGGRPATCRKLRSFLFEQSRIALRSVCSSSRGKKKGRAHSPGRKDSPSRERFRPPSRRTFRFRVVLLGGLRPTGAPCSAQTESRRSGGSDQGVSATKLRANCGCSAKTAESV
jgi:hypothetical protein